MQKSIKSEDLCTNENVLKGLKAIENRSKGLLDFVEWRDDKNSQVVG